MIGFDDLRSGLAQLRAYVDQRIGNLFGITSLARVSSMGDSDAVFSSDSDSAQRFNHRIEPWGLRSVPATKSRAFWFKLTPSNTFYFGIAPSKNFGPIDLEEGETALYCGTSGTIIKLQKDGNITIMENATKAAAR